MSLSFIFSISCLHAQNTYTNFLRNNNAGKGKVIIEQSAEIENVINNKKIKVEKPQNVTQTPAPVKNEKQPVKENKESQENKEKKEPHEELLDRMQAHHRTQQPAKMHGYRIQVYSGAKSSGQSEARRIEQKCKKELPGISTYVRFIQPRWTCRIGDFQTRQDAMVFMQKLREANISPQITIVKCEIFKVY